MPKAQHEVELTVRLGTEPGALGQVLSVLADRAINVLAYCAYTERHESILLLVSDSPVSAKAALTAAGYPCRANSVVLVGAPDHVGSAATVGARLGLAGVNILYSYASSASADRFFAVFKTNDNQRALAILNASERTADRAA